MEKMALGRKEASEKLGLSLPTLDSYMHRAKNPLPHIRAGRKIVIPCIALERWLQEEVMRTAGGESDGPII